MGIRFNLKRTKGEYSTIRAIVRIKGVKYTMSTGIKILVTDWDKKRERCNHNKTANTTLSALREKIQRSIKETGYPPHEIAPKRDQHKGLQVIEAIEAHRKRKELESTSPHTWRAYSTLIRNIERFNDEERRKECYVKDLSPEYIDGLIQWMQAQDYKNAHINKMIRTLRAVIRPLVPAEIWNQSKPPTPNHADQIFLTPDEIDQIANLQFEPGSHLHAARDLFLIGCYTGLRFSDWRQVDRSRIKTVNNTETITITQQKTKGRTTLPVTEKLRAVIDRYPRGLPTITNQTVNYSIKEIAQMLGMNEIVEITEYRGGKAINKRFEKWKLISSHTARRSFATNAILSGIPISEVMKFTGHQSITTFLQYVRTTGQDAAIKYANHPFFTGK